MQVKQSANISNTHSIYELRHELPNDFKLTILGNYELSWNSQHFLEWWSSAQSFCQNETLLKLAKNRNYMLPVESYFTWKLELVSTILWKILATSIFHQPQSLLIFSEHFLLFDLV